MNVAEMIFHSDFTSQVYFHPTEQKISTLKNLKNGWHYGDGVAFGKDAINAAFRLHREITNLGVDQTDVFPGLNGEFQITVYENENYFALERGPSGEWKFTREENDEEVESISELTDEEVLTKLKSALCNWLDFYQIGTGIVSERDSTTSPSSLHELTEEYPLLAANA